MEEAISRSEVLAKQLNTEAHDYDHLDRVRNWVTKIAQDENLDLRETFLLQIAALWHDMALDIAPDRSKHGEYAGALFLKEFSDCAVFTSEEKETICFVLKYHDKARLVRNLKTNKKQLEMLNILTDADTLELLGERGYKRAVDTVQARGWLYVDHSNPKGETFGFSATQFDERIKLKKQGKIKFVKEPTLVGHLNFQISCADNLQTRLAKEIGALETTVLIDKLNYLLAR